MPAWLACLLLLLAGAREGARAQTAPEWRWSHPLPHGNNVADLGFRSNLWVHVTDHGGILASTNRLVWDRRVSGTALDLRGLAFLGNRLLVVGENGTALWSDDATRFQAATVVPATTNWFEAVAVSPTRAVAVGDHGSIYQSANGTNWARVNGTGFTNWLSGVAYGAGVFVAAGELGFVATSPTGTNNWTRRNLGTTAYLTRVGFGDARVGGEARFLVTGEDGVVFGSVNGTSWAIDGSTGVTASLLAGVVGPGERVAIGEEAVLLRKTGAGWADQLSEVLSPSPAPAWTFTAGGFDGTRYLLGGRTGVFVESWRTNSGSLSGQTFWFRNDDSPRNWIWETHRFAGTYVAVGDRGTVLSSLSGVDWSLEAVPVAADVVLYGIGGSPELAVAVGSGGTILRSVASYTNVTVTQPVSAGGRTVDFTWTNQVPLLGLDWEPVAASPTTNTLQGIAWNGSLYVAVGAAGTVVRSSDASIWTRGATAGSGFLSSVAAMPGGWVATGATGSVFTSSDASTWTRRAAGTTNWLYRVRSFGNDLVAVGQNGTIRTSTDGVNWTARASGTGSWLTDVVSLGATWFVSGAQGTILRSTDLATWTALPTITGKALYGLASNGGQLIASGAEGVIIRAIAAPEFSPVAFRGYQHRIDGTPVVDAFAFNGTPEQGFQLQSAEAPGTWDIESSLTLDASGAAAYGRVANEARRFFRTKTGP